MRKTLGVTIAAVLLVVLVAGTAYAAIVQCRSVPCTASGNADIVNERVGNGKADRIALRGGDDLVDASDYTNDRDVVYGGSGYDRIKVDDGDTRDLARGGAGAQDWCIVDARKEAGRGCDRVTVD